MRTLCFIMNSKGVLMADTKSITNFVHLHVHSDYSLKQSCASIEKLIAKASELGMKSLALTDSDNMSGVPYFYKSCNDEGIKPIIGQEFKIKDRASCETLKLFKLVLLCQNETGYRNLCKLSSISYDKVSSAIKTPYIIWEELQKYHEGLICISGGVEGEFSQLFLEEKYDEAILRAKEYKELFGKNCFYLELQNHGFKTERFAIRILDLLSKELDLKLIATNDIYYISKEDAKAQEVLSCISQQTKINEPHKRLGDSFRLPEEDSSEWYFKSKEEMAELFSDYPDAIENTGKIAEMCNLIIKKYTQAEVIDNLPQIRELEDKSNADKFLRKQVFLGLEARYGVITKEIKERADYELDIITGKKFTNYFLFIWDLIRWAKSRLAIVYGSGSATGSIVNYALGITDIDPLRYGLHFERFINPKRDFFPFIDIDVDDEHEDEIIEHLRKEYGYNCVSNIINYDTLTTREILACVGSVLQIPYPEITKLKYCIPDSLYSKLDDAFTEQDWRKDNGKLLPYKDDPRYTELFDITRRLERIKYYKIFHDSDIVICNNEISNYVPIAKDCRSLKPYTQYTKEEIHDNGLLEYGFGAWDAITLIRYIENFINQYKHPEEVLFSAGKINNDQETYELFASGKTDGFPFFNGVPMQEYLRKLKPNCIEDLTALYTLYRHHSMDFIPMLISGKHNPEKIKYLDDSLRPVLAETYGMIVYQEQVMKILQIVAGYDLAEAEIIRRDLGKRKLEVIQNRKKDFIARALKNGYNKECAEEIFKKLEIDAVYSFCKAHAISYTKVAYQIAYLKVHYPVEFIAAQLNLKISMTGLSYWGDSIWRNGISCWLNQAKEMRVKVEKPNLNNDGVYFDIKNNRVLYGLKGLKGVSENLAKTIVAERELNGLYKSSKDFTTRMLKRIHDYDKSIYKTSQEFMEEDNEALLEDLGKNYL